MSSARRARSTPIDDVVDAETGEHPLVHAAGQAGAEQPAGECRARTVATLMKVPVMAAPGEL